MKKFNILGYDNGCHEETLQAFQHALNHSSIDIDHLSMKFCADSAETIDSILGDYDGGIFSMYAWKILDGKNIENILETTDIGTLFITTGTKEIRISHDCGFTERKKYGEPNKYFVASFGEYIDSLDARHGAKDSDIEDCIISQLCEVYKEAPVQSRFSTSMGRSLKGTFHCYMFFLVNARIKDLFGILWPLVKDSNSAIGSFELRGNIQQLTLLWQNKGYQLKNYPSEICRLGPQNVSVPRMASSELPGIGR